jgi:hypothetical protein
MILPVDGLGVGDVDDAALDVVGDGEVADVDGEGEVVAELTGDCVGVGLGDPDAATWPPTAFPSTQV